MGVEIIFDLGFIYFFFVVRVFSVGVRVFVFLGSFLGDFDFIFLLGVVLWNFFFVVCILVFLSLDLGFGGVVLWRFIFFRFFRMLSIYLGS